MKQPAAQTTQKQPFSKWYWSDWRADPKLKLCGLAARGLWMEMLAIMHEAEPHGHLLIEGRPVTLADLAALSGRPLREVTAAFADLEARMVFSRDAAGVPYSRRMLRDQAKAEQDKANGRKGGNPRLARKSESGDKRGDQRGVNPQTNPQKPEPEAIAIARKEILSHPTTVFPPDTARAGAGEGGGGGGEEVAVGESDRDRDASADGSGAGRGTAATDDAETRAPAVVKATAPSALALAGELRARLEARLNLGTPVITAPILAWLQAGATPALIEATIADLLSQRPGFTPTGIGYFGPAIARAIAAAQATSTSAPPATQPPAQAVSLSARGTAFDPVAFIKAQSKEGVA